MRIEGLGNTQIESALKEKYSGQRVLKGEIPVESFSILDKVGRDKIPAVLVLSPAATAAYNTDPLTFVRYTILQDSYHIFLSETWVDSLAILRPAGEGKIEVQGKNVDEWLMIDLNQGQELGLAVITDEEARNSSARYWATAFVFDGNQNKA